jgi:Cu2+-exporting ATPase
MQMSQAAEGAADEFEVYDHPLLRSEYLLPAEGTAELQESVLQLDNVRCAGCCATIEKKINAQPGIHHGEINYSSHQLRLGWDDSVTTLGKVMRYLDQLGYPAQPVNAQSVRSGAAAQLSDQRQGLIRQLGVAAALGMQVMVMSVCLYAGDWWGIDPDMARFFSYLSLLLTVPVLLYSGQSFLLGALGDLRRARIGMDVPIALGLTIAFIASVHALWGGQGDTYFDSITMFVLLVLGARLIELNCRHKALTAVNRFDAVLPVSATRMRDGNRERVPLAALQPSDLVQLDCGDTVPADGKVITGQSSFDESLLTGESVPVRKSPGDSVIAGTHNLLQPVTIEVSHVGEATRFSAIAQLVRRARFAKPQVSVLVERLARWFVMIVLGVAALVAWYGWQSGSSDFLATTIAVLIVSCPCALALATPAATSMAMSRALERGMLVTSGTAMETLARADHFFFDKTGTLTTGDFNVTAVAPNRGQSRERVIALARTLERYSAHPLAAAIDRLASEPYLPANDVDTRSNDGISATINQHRYHIGSAAFVQRITGMPVDQTSTASETIVVLADDSRVLGTFYCSDEIRPGAHELIRRLQRSGKRVSILSGDRQEAVRRVADALGIDYFFAECSPVDKLNHVSQAVAAGSVVAMLGDGVNDAPVVNAAHVSIALADRVNLTATHADIVALNSSMENTDQLLSMADRLTLTIRQNLCWALGYNALAIPFAAMGWVPPWLAALGMSASSLVVVVNASRGGESRQTHNKVRRE